MNLYVKCLIIEKEENTVSYTFRNGLAVILKENAPLVQAVLHAVLTGEPPPENLRFFSEVQMEERFYVRGRQGRMTVFRAGGEECTEDYFRILHRCTEEQSLNCFEEWKRVAYSDRLSKYKNADPEDRLPQRTDGYGTTDCFRSAVKQYIRSFHPIRLVEGEELWLHLLPSGRFEVKNGAGATVSLNESKKTVYHFWCFIYLARFWSMAEKLRNLHHVDLPLFVTGRVGVLTEALKRSAEFGRQIFLFNS